MNRLDPKLLEGILCVLADLIVERMAARAAPDGAGRWASAKDNPLGTARAFLDAGRRGDFPTFKRGRGVVARWSDVTAYIEARPCERKARPRPVAPPAPVDANARRRAQLVAAGVLQGGTS